MGDKQKTTEIVTLLNKLLASYQTFYQNLRGIHWNIKGKRFFELHAKFEELYLDANVKIDDIAERILTLDGVPFHTLQHYVSNTTVEVGENVTQDQEAVKLIVSSLQALLILERKVLELSGDAND